MLTRWDPFVDFARLSKDMFRYPEAFNGDAKNGFVPAVDVAEEKDAFLVTAELPGLKAEEIQINVEKNVLTLSGERKLEQKEPKDEKAGYVRLERAYGAFTRSFVLPETADGEKVDANLSDGLLKVRIPKRASAQPRKITVKAS
jgi:HSP20 family protein